MSVVAVVPVAAVGGLVAAEVEPGPEPGPRPVAVVAATLGSGAAG